MSSINKAIPYGRQHITEEDIQAVVNVLKSDFLTQGPTIAEFEIQFAKYIGCRYAVAVANGTAALHLGAIALGVKPGDKVITTPITFAASSNCIQYCGGEVTFCDVDPDTYLMDVDQVKKLLAASPKGTYKGIIPVDFAGHMVNLEKLHALASEYGLWIMEDACHAPGAYFKDSKNTEQRAGGSSYADLSVFSFHPVKHVATGEGGMITTNDEKLYQLLLKLRTHGIVRDHFEKNIADPELQGGWYHEMQELGYNYRITDIQCALGISQLKRAPQGLIRRNELADRYRKAFKGTAIKCQKVEDASYHAYHLFVIHVADRKGLYDHLKKFNIHAQVHYIPTHLMPYYQKLGWKSGDFPKAERYYEGCLSLPMFPTLTNDEQDFVISKVVEFSK
jgi:UDP-4-amino-4,6-dideoxy-N-acetyl-beta-L-altrosamine transaminase